MQGLKKFLLFSFLFVSHITVGGGYLPTKYFQPEIADLIIAVIIYLCAFVSLFKGVVLQALTKKKEKNADANTRKGAAE